MGAAGGFITPSGDSLLLLTLTDVGTDPRHAELTLLVMFMTCLKLLNIVVNTPLGCRKKKKNSAPLQPPRPGFLTTTVCVCVCVTLPVCSLFVEH